MKVYLATDHAGFELKEKTKNHLMEEGFDVQDCGTFSFDQNDDYPDFVGKAAEKVSNDPQDSMGIVFGKSGAGEEIVANKFKGVRCVLGFSEENVKLSREHNDVNVLSLGSQFVDFETTIKLVDIFLKTAFSGDERHVRRIRKITEIEQKNYA